MKLGLSEALGKLMSRRMYDGLRRSMAVYERQHLSSPPITQLEAQHLRNARLLPTRQDLLECLPTGGVVAELGVDEGDFSAEILATCQPDQLHLVDCWGSERYGQRQQELVVRRFAAECASGAVQIHLGQSVELADMFADATFDWIYIDTDHSYTTTRDELRAYRRTIKPGGYLVGHDYAQGNWSARLRYGVVEAVQEFCLTYGWELAYLTTEQSIHPSFALRRLAE